MKRRILATMILAAAAVWAQPQAAPPEADDTSGDTADRSVARISYMSGNVSVRHGDSGELVAAVLNAPLAVTDRLVTGDGGRAELQFDGANLIRLGPGTEVRLSDLRYHHYQVQIAVGVTTFTVLRDSDAQTEISTPSVSVRPLGRGAYRVTVKPDGTSEITVRAGNAEIFSPQGSEQLQGGRTMLSRGTASDPEFQVIGAVPEDDFDRWNASRDNALTRSQSARYVNPDVYGTEELDANGRWVNDGSYGNVWVPNNVDPDWAPYRQGRWSWVDYYGWSWVSYDPWGWAPYHYGRWYRGSFGWTWWPGPIMGPCYWRPALVGFFGWGGGVGVGFGFGNVGWVPLAPFERFHPWYGRGIGAGFRNGVIVNNTNITNVYRNARIGNGVTSVRSGDFGRTSVNNGNFVRANAGDLQRAGMVRGQMPVTPSRESSQFTNRSANTSGVPRTSDSTRFVSRGQSPQRGFGNSAGAPASNGGGWRKFDPSSRGSAPGAGSNLNRGGSSGPAAQGNSGNSNGGWRRFDGTNQNQAPRNSGSQPGGQPQYNGNRGSSPQPSGTYSRPQQQQQPVRISPPIIQNRGNSGGGNNGGGSPRPSNNGGGGGSPRPSGGGGGSRPSGGGGGGTSHNFSGGGGGFHSGHH